MPLGPAHAALAAFDIEKSSDPAKTDDILRAMRPALLGVLREAINGAAISWSRCTWLDQGDGGTLVAPGEDEFRIVDPLAGHLAAALRRYNRRSSPLTRIRLRMAAHSGPLYRDAGGLSGAPLVHLARLLDAEPLRTQLATAPADLAVLVSDSLYGGIVRHDYGLLDPAVFHEVEVRVKETNTRAWLLGPPGRPAAPAAPAAGRTSPQADGPAPQPAPQPAGPPAADHGMQVSIGAVHGVAMVGPMTVNGPQRQAEAR